jgi:hypothetical protein
MAGLLKKEDLRDEFALWLATPKHIRKIKSSVELAKSFNVSAETLSRWKKEPDFETRREKYIGIYYRDKVTDVIYGLYQKAKKDGSANEVKLFLELVGYYTPNKRIDVNVRSTENEFDRLPLDEKRKIKELLEKGRQEVENQVGNIIEGEVLSDMLEEEEEDGQ